MREGEREREHSGALCVRERERRPSSLRAVHGQSEARRGIAITAAERDRGEGEELGKTYGLRGGAE